eukprot:TRINITY_DN45132_c0_g1_i1.p1 TRINITY_DN45132_c0_g1~~TRINITY_DN45132_c0_g1_i1.p1  ORF type:complete len:314 (-),score=23.04 TRINITY_DN45132_c0_g1_i1:34-975(-)
MGQELGLACAGDDISRTPRDADLFRHNDPPSRYASQIPRGPQSPRTRVTVPVPAEHKDGHVLEHLFGGPAEMLDARTGKMMRTDVFSLFQEVSCGYACKGMCNTSDGAEGAPRLHPPCADADSHWHDHTCTEGEVLPASWAPAPLSTPGLFNDLKYDWSAPASSQVRLSEDQQVQLQSCLKSFVHKLVCGVLVQLRLDVAELDDLSHAQNIDAVLSLTDNLSNLSISVGGSERIVKMRSVKSVRPSESATGTRSWFGTREHEPMVNLRLDGGRFLRIRFDSTEQANYFGTCMRLLTKAARGLGGARNTSTQAA